MKFLIACMFLFSASIAVAAPGLNGGMEPNFFKLMPHQLPAVPTNKSIAGISTPSIKAASTPSSARAILLRVQFQPDADSKTTGDGTWLCDTGDPTCPLTSDVGVDGNYWVNQNISKLENYYSEVSYGKFSLSITVAPSIYTLPQKMSYYGGETAADMESLIYDAVTTAAAKDPSIDFSQFDVVFIVHAGVGQETDVKNDTSSDIWSLYYHDTKISPQNDDSLPGLTVNGVSITSGVIMPQTDSQDGNVVDPLGVFAHEFGHWLGLPDLYGTPFLIIPTWDGIGDWGLMSYGMYLGNPIGSSPAELSAWSKVYLGWVTPTVADPNTDPGALSLPPVETSPSIIKIPNSDDGSKYYLLENRQKSYFDSGLKGSGLLLWQINDDVISSNMSTNTVNSNSGSPGVKLIEADGDDALLTYGGDQGSAGDPFPGTSGNTAFTPWTTPGSANADQNGWLYLTNMAQNGDGSISYSLAFSPKTPGNISEDITLTNGIKLHWDASKASDFAYYKIYIGDKPITTVHQNEFETVPVLKDQDFRVTAVDTSGHESGMLNKSSIKQDLRCFIATAAYGSPFEPAVSLLRKFRNRFLLTNSPGKVFVKTYYRFSPPLAHFISKHIVLRAIVRVLLLPLILFAWVAMHLGFIMALVLMVLMSFLAILMLKKSKYLIMNR